MTATSFSNSPNSHQNICRFHVEVSMPQNQKPNDFGDLDPFSQSSYSQQSSDPVLELLSSPTPTLGNKSFSKCELFDNSPAKKLPLSKHISVSKSTPRLSIYPNTNENQNKNGRFTITHERRKIELTIEPIIEKPQNNSFNYIISTLKNEETLIDFQKPSNSSYSGKFTVDVTLDSPTNSSSSLVPPQQDGDLIVF